MISTVNDAARSRDQQEREAHELRATIKTLARESLEAHEYLRQIGARRCPQHGWHRGPCHRCAVGMAKKLVA